jgi:hypothetical protein
MGIEFQAWPKTPRLRKAGSTTITEKIDGTNACVVIDPEPLLARWETGTPMGEATVVNIGETSHLLYAQSRNRIITPDSDNAGFARWAHTHAAELADLLGVGRHFGEWWGQGIQRRYGMTRKVFSLFNANRWERVDETWQSRAFTIHMDIVPVLYRGVFSDMAINESLSRLQAEGSIAARMWGQQGQKAEGIVLRHADLGGNLKVMLENDDVPKSQQ